MKRPGPERIKRRTHIRLSLEHLEHRRLMAGLNVLVFNDQDGSRSLSPSVDTPAPNRLVYVDLNRDLQYQSGEPLAVAGEDGIARFPDLPAGNYFIGLAANSSAQLLTTSIAPDAVARPVSTATSASGAPLTSLIASSDLKNAWSVTSSGVLTPVGSEDAGRPVINLNGQVLGITSSSGRDNVAWALVDHGQPQPTLYRLDFQTGAARMTNMQGLPGNQVVSGLVRAGIAVYLQTTAGDTTYLAELRTNANGVSFAPPVPVPSGRLIGSSVNNQLLIVGNRSEASGEGAQSGARVNVVQVRGSTASIQSIDLESSVSHASFSPDGQTLFVSSTTGGTRVLTISGGLRTVAELAEAAGPVSSSVDGRFVTGNATKPDQLIVWDSSTWTPTGRVQLPKGQGPIVGLTVDSFGDRVLVATASGAASARLSNPLPQPIEILGGSGVTQVNLGVRLIDRPVTLPSRIEISQSTDEDVPLRFDLASESALRGLGSGLFFVPSGAAALGTLSVTPSGRVSYLARTNANGSDTATLRVFDGVSATTLVISLDVRPVNDAPSALTFDAFAIDESASAGDLAGLATVIDVDSDSSYEITTSDSRFIVIDGQLLLGATGALDYESEPSIELEITATDLSNPAFVITRKITVPVRDTNDGPSGLSLDGNSVVENEMAATVGRVAVEDPDQHGTYSYSVSDERFEFDGGVLRLRDGVVLDHETEAVIALTITVTDDSAVGSSTSVSSDVTVLVIDSNDAPTGLTVATYELPSGRVAAVVGQVSVTDQDVGDTFVFSVSDSRFIVDGNVLRLRDGQSVSREQEAVVTMMVTVTDRGGAVLSETVTLNVINDAPFQNPRDPFDVDNDGVVIPRDAIILVNHLNQKGSHILTPITAAGEGGIGESFFLDINGDGVLSPLDALILINHLNQRSTPAINNGNNGSGSGNNNGGTAGSGGPIKLPEQPLTEAEGEGESEAFAEDATKACQPWLATSAAEEKARRDAIDAELELLVEELSRARLS